MCPHALLEALTGFMPLIVAEQVTSGALGLTGNGTVASLQGVIGAMVGGVCGSEANQVCGVGDVTVYSWRRSAGVVLWEVPHVLRRP